MSNSESVKRQGLDRLLTVAEAAEALDVSEEFVRKLIFRKEISYVKLGRAVRIEESALHKLIEASRVTSSGG